MPSAQGRKRGRTDSAEAEEQPSEDQSVEDTGPDLVSQQHGYGTRRSNQAARPGVAAGLAKRYKADIQAEANKKKDVEAAKKSKQEKQRAVKAAREQDSAKTVAAMQDRRAREEIEEIAFMDRTPPPVDDDLDDVPARHAGKIADGHELPRAQRHSNAEVEPDPLNDESDSHSDFSSSEDESAPPQVQSTRSKKRSEAERRVERVNAVRGPISELRDVNIRKAGEPTGRRDTLSKPPTSKVAKSKALQGDAFTPDFRRRVRTGKSTENRNAYQQPNNNDDDDIVFLGEGSRSQSLADRSDKTTAPPRDHDDWLQDTFSFLPDTNGNPTPLASSFRQRQLDTPLPEEEIGGLADADVITPAPPPSRKNTELVFRGPAKNMMVGIMANSDIQGDVVVSPTKKTRAPKKRLPGALSRAFEALPSWIQNSIISIIIPSLIKYYGAQDNPWSLDGDNQKFRTTFTALVRKLHPGHEDDVSRGDKMWAFARQGLSDWRSRIMKTGIRIVQVAAKAHGSPVAISIWASNALAKGGEATYSHPNTLDHKAARGAVQSPYIVQLLTVHYEAAEGAILDVGYPVGALSMAAVAIRRAFQTMTTGTFVAPSDDFSEDNYGTATKKVREGSVQGLLDHKHRFDALIATAMSQVASYKADQAEGASRTELDEDAYNAVDPPTSPPAADQY